MHVVSFPLGPLETNCYLIHDGKEAVAVDPGGPPDQVTAYLNEKGLTLTHILLTHLHFDHTAGVAALVRATGAAVLASANDSYMLENDLGKGGVWGMPANEPFAFTNLEPGELPLLGSSCRVLATPGHSPGGLSFYFSGPGAVFAGDALFYRSVGRTDFPGSDHGKLMASIREKLFSLPDETTVHCGHGPDTCIGDEKLHNPFTGDQGLV